MRPHPCQSEPDPGHDLEVVQLLLTRDELVVHTPDHAGQTALSHAAAQGHTEVVALLLQHSATTHAGR